MNTDRALGQHAPRHSLLRLQVRDLNPAYFAMVMATGTVSIAFHLLGYQWAAVALLVLNVIAYVVLLGLTAMRVAWFAERIFSDLADHLRGPGFFTTVASPCILGSQFIIILQAYWIAAALWLLAILLWIALTYTIFAALTIKEAKPTLAQGISGGWLLAVVATQSIVVLSTFMAAHWQQPYRVEINFFALSMWLWGGMLYIWMMSLIFYRYTFFAFNPGDLSPPYWINMGAMAISTLAGAQLIINTPDAPFLRSLLPFLKGFTVFYWATGTWWIPMLLILGVWRHVYKKFPLRYDPLYWGAVFPLAMYTVCTLRMSRAMELPFLQFLPRVFIWIALAAWLAAFVGLARHLVRLVRGVGAGMREETSRKKTSSA